MCQLAPPCPRITLSELKALRVSHSFKHCAAAQRPWAWKPCFGSQGGLKIMIFMTSGILATVGSQIRHLFIDNSFQWEATELRVLPIDAELKDLSDGHSPSENDLRNLRHFQGWTVVNAGCSDRGSQDEPAQRWITWKLLTSPTLLPNYSYLS